MHAAIAAVETSSIAQSQIEVLFSLVAQSVATELPAPATATASKM